MVQKAVKAKQSKEELVKTTEVAGFPDHVSSGQVLTLARHSRERLRRDHGKVTPQSAISNRPSAIQTRRSTKPMVWIRRCQAHPQRSRPQRGHLCHRCVLQLATSRPYPENPQFLPTHFSSTAMLEFHSRIGVALAPALAFCRAFETGADSGLRAGERQVCGNNPPRSAGTKCGGATMRVRMVLAVIVAWRSRPVPLRRPPPEQFRAGCSTSRARRCPARLSPRNRRTCRGRARP